MNKQQIKELALSNGFQLKEQPDGTLDLNPYVYEFSSALLAEAGRAGFVACATEFGFYLSGHQVSIVNESADQYTKR